MTTRIDDFRAILDGSSSQHLTAAWQHFVGEEFDPQRFAQASIDFVKAWDWDWVKVNPRATYYSEIWGSRYDPEDYQGPIPRLITPAISGPADLARISPIAVADSPVLLEHLTSARLIREALDDRVVLQTIFSPLSVLLQLAGLPLYPGDAPYGSSTQLSPLELLTSDPAATRAALQAIAETLAGYLAELVAPLEEGGAGLDGVFYAVTGTADEGFLPDGLFAEFSTPYDLQVLAAAQDHLVLLHTCRAASHPEWFTDYPADAIHWDQFLPGNPPISHDLGSTPVGGVNYTLFGPGQDRTQILEQLDATLQARAGRGFLLAPSCTIPSPADEQSLRLLRQA